MHRRILAQLMNSDDLEALDPNELRAMLAALDDEIAYGDDDIEVRIPS